MRLKLDLGNFRIDKEVNYLELLYDLMTILQ